MPLHSPSPAALPVATTRALPSAGDLDNPVAGVRQLWIVVLASLWIATVCNVALWRALANLPGLSAVQAATISVALALVIALATGGLLSLLAWR